MRHVTIKQHDVATDNVFILLLCDVDQLADQLRCRVNGCKLLNISQVNANEVQRLLYAQCLVVSTTRLHVTVWWIYLIVGLIPGRHTVLVVTPHTTINLTSAWFIADDMKSCRSSNHELH